VYHAAVPIIFSTLLNHTGITPANRVRDQHTNIDPTEFLSWLADQLRQERNYAHWAWRFNGGKSDLLELATCSDVEGMMKMALSRMNDRRYKVPTEILIMDKKVCLLDLVLLCHLTYASGYEGIGGRFC
jgi:hypothetical protein